MLGTGFYARPRQLWMDQRLDAEKRYGHWDRGIYEMDGRGENARIIRRIDNPSRATFIACRGWDEPTINL